MLYVLHVRVVHVRVRVVHGMLCGMQGRHQLSIGAGALTTHSDHTGRPHVKSTRLNQRDNATLSNPPTCHLFGCNAIVHTSRALEPRIGPPQRSGGSRRSRLQRAIHGLSSAIRSELVAAVGGFWGSTLPLSLLTTLCPTPRRRSFPAAAAAAARERGRRWWHERCSGG